MNEIVKNKMQREIMVVKNDELFKNFERKDGFYKNEEFNFEEVILWNYKYMTRHIAEENFDYKQPIPYGIVIDEENNIFVYKRGGKISNAGETRLHSKIAFGVGGHLEQEDEGGKNPLKEGLVREIEEELNLAEKDIKTVEAIGYINEDDGAVSEVHFGVAYVIKVHNTNFKLLDGELENGEFISLEKLEQMINSGEYDVENWSKILFNPLKQYLNK